MFASAETDALTLCCVLLSPAIDSSFMLRTSAAINVLVLPQSASMAPRTHIRRSWFSANLTIAMTEAGRKTVVQSTLNTVWEDIKPAINVH